MEARILGVKFSVDEPTIGFQGNHLNKLFITYNAKGGRFQCDSMWQDRYTFTFYFRDQTAPKIYTNIVFSPFHSHVISLLYCIWKKFHQCGMYNLYMPLKFFLKYEEQVLVAGTARKGALGTLFIWSVGRKIVGRRTESVRHKKCRRPPCKTNRT